MKPSKYSRKYFAKMNRYVINKKTQTTYSVVWVNTENNLVFSKSFKTKKAVIKYCVHLMLSDKFDLVHGRIYRQHGMGFGYSTIIGFVNNKQLGFYSNWCQFSFNTIYSQQQ